jgi:hypothetical protein
MADPISIVAGIAGVVKGSAKIAQSLSTLKRKFDFAELNIASLRVVSDTTDTSIDTSIA